MSSAAPVLFTFPTYFARGFAVMGRSVIVKDGEAKPFEMLLATVNINLPDGESVASDIAEVLNEKFQEEIENV